MKILKLELQAFGPFLHKQVVDFEELNDKGMFLINGPTGTGKTSLFDAIVFALFGQGSGKDRGDSKSLRSDFATADIATYVDLTFEANGKKYRIYRQPAYERLAKKGGGTTMEEARAILYMPDGSTISKSTDVNNKIIEEILFININQFKSIALLAQGEFTQLITAKSEERASILEHIFQQEIYKKVQEKLKERRNEVYKECTSKKDSLITLVKQVEKGEEIIGYNEALLDPSNTPIFIDNSSVIYEESSRNLIDVHTKTEETFKLYNDLNAKLQALKTSNKQIKNYQDAVKSLAILSEKENYYNNLQKRVDTQFESDKISPILRNIDNLDKDCERQKKIISDSSNNLKSLNKKEEEHVAIRGKYVKNKHKVIEYAKIIANYKKLIHSKDDLMKDRTSLMKKDEEFAEKLNKFKAFECEFHYIRDRFYASSSYNLAKLLEDGKPCPVCGSTTHPRKADFQNPVSEEDFNKVEKDYKEFENKIKELNTLLNSLNAALREKEKVFIDILKENGFDDANKNNIYLLDLNEMCFEVEDKLEEASAFISNYEREEKSLLSDKARVTQSIDSARQSLENNLKRKYEFEKNLSDVLAANKTIKNLDDYNSFMNPIDANDGKVANIKSAQAEIAKYKSDVATCSAIIESTPNELIDQKLGDEEVLINEVKEKKNEYDALNKEENSINNRMKNLKRDIESIKESYKEYKEALSKYDSLNELSEVASGNNSLKLSFKLYILSDYFDKILTQANIRLKTMSNGRYELVRKKELGIGRGQNGLDLDVFDMETGKERAASSLSGGEKFIAALSMALGLSDIIETNRALVQVESIFIDEGFGSLDEESIDLAMKALESLKDDNKTVAIISHVEKLKEYIPDGLEIKKADIGSKVAMKEYI